MYVILTIFLLASTPTVTSQAEINQISTKTMPSASFSMILCFGLIENLEKHDSYMEFDAVSVWLITYEREGFRDWNFEVEYSTSGTHVISGYIFIGVTLQGILDHNHHFILGVFIKR